MIKQVNFTADQTATLVAKYQAADTDAARATVMNKQADKLGKTIAQIRGKLVAEKVYVAKNRATATGAKVTTKAAYAQAIAIMVGVKELPSLENAKVNDLRALQGALVALSDKENLKA